MEEHGPTEKAYRQWIQTMEPLTPVQKTRAEVIYRLARNLDQSETDKTSSATAAVARALLTAADKFRDVPQLFTAVPAEEPTSPIQSVRDELASRRNRGKEVS